VKRPKSHILLICLLAFALRLGPLFDNRFHPDEALFSTWSLQIARGENPLLTGVPIDKPPLLIYLNAISFFVFGQSELAARVPNLIASVISVVLVWRLGGWLPPLLLALSPLAISFAPTAFLDPMMVMFGLAALVAASRGRLGWAGILLGFSFATKVQGLFFAPLVLVYGSRRPSISPFLRLAVGFAFIALLVLLWDRARGGVPFWIQQTINYGDLRLIYPGELGPRLIGWAAFLPYFFGPIVGVLGLIGLPWLIRSDLKCAARDRAARIDLALLAWLSGLIALHGLLNFPIWDRYFLLLVPIAALLAGRAIHHLVPLSLCPPVPRSLCRLVTRAASVAIIAFALPFSTAAAESHYPIGGDHGANDGIEQVAAYLKTLPAGAVVYDHWLAWELDYYLGRGFVYLAYFDTPGALADDVRAFGRDNRYVIFPLHEAPDGVSAAIEPLGYELVSVFSTQNRFDQTSFTVFKIQPR
jgi:4-amino-4-deoxy-L-arabinose transferase-like glycosyltransferase